MDVLMPQLGETVAEGKISKWFVSAGDAVKPGDNLFEIETDKVSMEVPAIAAGTLAAIHVQAGEVAPVGAVVAVIEGKGETVSLQKPPSPVTPAKAGVQKAQELGPRVRVDERVQSASPQPAAPMEPFREVRSPERNYGPARLPGGTTVTPLARRLAGERGIDLANVKGSGPHGRIVAADVESARRTVPAAAALGAMPIVLTADVAIDRSLALCSDANAAQKTALELADVVIKAWATALARITPSENTGIALAMGKHRSTITDAATKSLTAISAARRADADGSASSAISIPAVAGITSVSDVLSSPQTTLLSLGAPRRAPVEAEDGSIKFVSVITATLSCDHRAVDATTGAELLSAFKGFVEQPVTMIV
ncbi:MAG TPA: biotin/lipoyl-containing protein [Xanthobacteraceae bacterium]|nr:biotin/lipoyl-containing protein [Xanthobacteraceae bacterium]